MLPNNEINAYQRVLNSRNGKRNMGGYYINQIIDNFIELHGDRGFGDDPAIVGGVGFLAGIPIVGIVFTLLSTLIDLYLTAGIIFSILDYCKVIYAMVADHY